MNVVIISGTLHKLWDVKQTKNGTNTRGFVLEHESQNGYKSRFDVSAFGQTADRLLDFSEGDKLMIQGELQRDSYQKDGAWVEKVKVIARSVERFGAVPVPQQSDEFAGVAASDSDDDVPW